MSLKDLDIKLSYISCGEENIAKSFLVPALKHTKRYRRSVGFFSSGVFGPIIDGIVALSRNGGKIELIASPQLSDEDIKAINLGYQKREEIIMIQNYVRMSAFIFIIFHLNGHLFFHIY